MAEFVTVVKELQRLCIGNTCQNCPLGQNGLYAYCNDFIKGRSSEVEEIIMKWAKEHPRKTLRDRFFELFPNAPRGNRGNPETCPSRLGWGDASDEECGDRDCSDCWSRPWEEGDTLGR